MLGNARPIPWALVVYSLSQMYPCSFFPILLSICLAFTKLALESQDKVDVVSAFMGFPIFRAEFLNLGTMGILDWMTLCCRGLSCAL